MSGTDVLRKLWVKDGDLTVHTYQDVEDIIERNKVLRNSGQQTGDFRHKASIPLNIINQWLNEEYARGNVDLRLGSEEFDKIIAKKLRDHDWLFLRTDK